MGRSAINHPGISQNGGHEIPGWLAVHGGRTTKPSDGALELHHVVVRKVTLAVRLY